MATSRDLEEMGALHWLVGCISHRLSELELTPTECWEPLSLDRFGWVLVLQDSKTKTYQQTSIRWLKWGSARYSQNPWLTSSKLVMYVSFENW